MGEHKANDKALFEASLPSLMPSGEKCGIGIDMHVLPQPHVRLLLSSQWRTNDLGTLEIADGDGWKAAGEIGGHPVEVFELGKLLPPDKCDVVFMLSTVVEGNANVFAPGKRNRRLSNVPHIPLWRIPLDEWRREHAENLGGDADRQTV